MGRNTSTVRRGFEEPGTSVLQTLNRNLPPPRARDVRGQGRIEATAGSLPDVAPNSHWQKYTSAAHSSGFFAAFLLLVGSSILLR